MKQARQTWDDLATVLVNTYGPDRGELIVRSITQDSAANAAPNRPVTITLTTLTCIDQEDLTGKDDAKLNVFVPMPGQTLNTLVFRSRMNATDASVFSINRSFTYNPSQGTWGNGRSARSPKNGFVGLELIELDTFDPNDNLGTQFIDPSKPGPGSVTFRVDSVGSKTIGVGESAEYRLDYVVS